MNVLHLCILKFLDFVIFIGTNACGRNNGGCSHLCLAHPADFPTNDTYHCACPTHYTLNGDRTCSGKINVSAEILVEAFIRHGAGWAAM